MLLPSLVENPIHQPVIRIPPPRQNRASKTTIEQ